MWVVIEWEDLFYQVNFIPKKDKIILDHIHLHIDENR